jgi:hypothetical protein
VSFFREQQINKRDPLTTLDILIEKVSFHKCLQRKDGSTVNWCSDLGEKIVFDNLIELFRENEFHP